VYLGISHGFTPDQAESFVEWLVSGAGTYVVQTQVPYANVDYGYWPLSGPYKVLGSGNRLVDVQRANPFIGGLPWINEVKTGGPISFATADEGSTAVYQGMKDGGLIASKRVAGSTWWFLPNLACVSGATGNFSNFLQFDEHVNLVIFKCDGQANDSLYTEDAPYSYEFESNAYPVDAQEVFPPPPFQFDNSCPGSPSFAPVPVSTS
jgi:hypothetical protein